MTQKPHKRSLTWGGSRTIEYVEVEKGVHAFRSEIFQDGVSKRVHEGLATLASLKKVHQDAPIKELEKPTGYGNQRVYLCKPGIIAGWKTYSYGLDEWHKNLDDHLIRKPFTYLQEHGRGDTVLLVPNTGDANLYGMDGSVYPKAIHFTYIRGMVQNGRYDLKASLEILKARTDILWGMGEDRSYSWKPVEPGPKIHAVPYYNVSEGCSSYLDFTWQPTQEDWDKVKGRVKESYSFEEAILVEVLGLPRIPEPSEHERYSEAAYRDYDLD